MVSRVSWWLLRRIARYPRADAVLLTECPVVARGTSYGVVVPLERDNRWCTSAARYTALELCLMALGYDLEALDRDNPFNGWMR